MYSLIATARVGPCKGKQNKGRAIPKGLRGLRTWLSGDRPSGSGLGAALRGDTAEVMSARMPRLMEREDTHGHRIKSQREEERDGASSLGGPAWEAGAEAAKRRPQPAAFSGDAFSAPPHSAPRRPCPGNNRGRSCFRRARDSGGKSNPGTGGQQTGSGRVCVCREPILRLPTPDFALSPPSLLYHPTSRPAGVRFDRRIPHPPNASRRLLPLPRRPELKENKPPGPIPNPPGCPRIADATPARTLALSRRLPGPPRCSKLLSPALTP